MTTLPSVTRPQRAIAAISRQIDAIDVILDHAPDAFQAAAPAMRANLQARLNHIQTLIEAAR